MFSRMTRQTRFVLPSTLVLFAVGSLAHAQLELLGSAEYGPHAVGFTVVHEYDYARTYKPKYDYDGNPVEEENAWPVQVAIWYPAVPADDTKRMEYREYIHLAATEEAFGEVSEQARQATEAMYLRWGQGAWNAEAADLRGVLESTTVAIRDARAQSGRFPLVLYAPGGRSWGMENSVLCEYLASHGYIVAATSSTLKPLLRGDVPAQVDAQLRDLEFLAAHMRAFPNVNRDKLATVAFSLGGVADVLFALRNHDVDAIVSLDGAMGNKAAATRHLESHGPLDPSRMRASVMLMLSGETESHREFIDALTFCDSYVLRFAELVHFDFNAFLILQRIHTLPDAEPEKKTAIKDGYAAISRYTLEFLNAYLKHDDRGREFLRKSPTSNGAGDWLTVASREGQKAPPTEDQFIRIIQDQGPERGARIYFGLRKGGVDTPFFSEASLNRLGYGFLRQERLDHAVIVFKMNAAAFPTSGNAFDSLGEAFARSGRADLAIRSYERSLELAPDNANAVSQLDRLRND